jgi:hypothetical protein
MKNVLPNLALIILSLLLTFAALEGGARLLYPAQRTGSCTIEHPAAIYQYMPNCTYKEKNIENTEAVTYSFNSCGYRSPYECKAKPDNSIRVVSLGDSFMLGAMSPIEDHFIYRMLNGIESRLSDPPVVDWQNLGTAGYDPLQYYARFGEALDLAPDLVVISVTPNDLFSDLSLERLDKRQKLVQQVGGESALLRQERGFDIVGSTKRLVQSSRALTLASVYMLSNDRIYYQTYLARGSNSDFLNEPLPEVWDERIAQVSKLLKNMMERGRDKGVEFIVVFIPQRIQNVIIDLEANNERVNPFLLANKLGASLNGEGLLFVDGLVVFQKNLSEERLYFPVDGHLTSAGNRILGDFLVEKVFENEYLRTIFEGN